MATLSRAEVVARAYDIFPKCGYIWGGYPNGNSHCMLGANGVGVESSSGPYLSTDCSGFTSWCWMTRQKYGSYSWGPNGNWPSHYRPRVANTGDIETDFPGITPGDVLWRYHNDGGHVALYVGGEEVILQASTKHWLNTNTGRGMRYGKDSLNYLGYCSYDNSSFSWDWDDYPDFNPDTEDISPGPHTGYPNPTPPGDVSDDFRTIIAYNEQYTKRYTLMKAYRRS